MPGRVDRDLLAMPPELPAIALAAGQPLPDAVMPAQIIGNDERGVLSEIGRRGHGEEADVAAETDRDHVARPRFAEPPAGIKALLDDIDQSSLGDEVELHLRI